MPGTWTPPAPIFGKRQTCATDKQYCEPRDPITPSPRCQLTADLLRPSPPRSPLIVFTQIPATRVIFLQTFRVSLAANVYCKPREQTLLALRSPGSVSARPQLSCSRTKAATGDPSANGRGRAPTFGAAAAWTSGKVHSPLLVPRPRPSTISKHKTIPSSPALQTQAPGTWLEG